MKKTLVKFLQIVAITTTCSLPSIGLAQALESIAGCSADSFVQGTENNQINTAGITYTPRCLKIKVGASVTIQASSRHPLQAMPNIDQALNPFLTESAHTTAQTRIMNEPGIYGYFCTNHGDAKGGRMAGVIIVEE